MTPHCGSHCHQLHVDLTLQFLWRRPQPVVVRAYVVEAKGLRAKDEDGSSDPFIVTTLGPQSRGPSRAHSASRSLRRALLTPQVNAGSLYRGGEIY